MAKKKHKKPFKYHKEPELRRLHYNFLRYLGFCANTARNIRQWRLTCIIRRLEAIGVVYNVKAEV